MTAGVPTGLVVREAGAGELEPVLSLLRGDVIREVDEDGEPVSSYLDAFEEIRADPHQDLLVGVIGPDVVATAQLTWARRLTYVGGLMCIVESVRVRPDLRGRGIGRSLMADVLGRARSRGAVRVELTTNAARERARTFYEDLGFRPSHVGMKHYLGGER